MEQNELNKLVEPITKVIDIVGGFITPLQKMISNKIERENLKKSLDLCKDYSEIDFLKVALSQLNNNQGITSESSEIYKMIMLENMKEQIEQRINLKQIGLKSLDYLPEKVADEKFNDEFVTNFKNRAKYISDSEVQSKWAQILAGEIEKPGSFSIKTLSILETMGKEDIELFSRICKLTSDGNILFFDYVKWNKKFNISLDDLSHLGFLGLIQPNFFLVQSFIIDDDNVGKAAFSFIINNKVYLFNFLTNGNKDMPSIMLTQSGIELLKLVEISYSQEYIDHCIESFKTIFPIDTIYIADIEKDETGVPFYDDATMVLLS